MGLVSLIDQLVARDITARKAGEEGGCRWERGREKGVSEYREHRAFISGDKLVVLPFWDQPQNGLMLPFEPHITRFVSHSIYTWTSTHHYS